MLSQGNDSCINLSFKMQFRISQLSNDFKNWLGHSNINATTPGTSLTKDLFLNFQNHCHKQTSKVLSYKNHHLCNSFCHYHRSKMFIRLWKGETGVEENDLVDDSIGHSKGMMALCPKTLHRGQLILFR